MAIPTISDLVLYVNKALTGNDWNTNWRKVINWLTDGKTDIKVKSLEIAEGGELINNGSIQQSGDLNVTGALTVGGNITTDGTITGDGSGLYNVSASSNFPFTPFAINAGYRDANGNGDLISATAVVSGGVTTGYTIAFKVDNDLTYGKIKATSASGEHFVIAALNSETITSNGTFYFFIKSGETFVTTLSTGVTPSIDVYRQPTAPTAVENNVWLDTSQEKLVCKKYSSGGQWETWDYVPLGKIVVDNIGTASATATVTTFLFNNNGYAVNLANCPNLQDVSQRPGIVVKSWTSGANWYRLYSDGWVEQGGASTSNATINLHLAMTDTNYNVMVQMIRDTQFNEAVFAGQLTTTSFRTHCEHTTDVRWRVSGYIA